MQAMLNFKLHVNSCLEDVYLVAESLDLVQDFPHLRNYVLLAINIDFLQQKQHDVSRATIMWQQDSVLDYAAQPAASEEGSQGQVANRGESTKKHAYICCKEPASSACSQCR